VQIQARSMDLCDGHLNHGNENAHTKQQRAHVSDCGQHIDPVVLEEVAHVDDRRVSSMIIRTKSTRTR
jgi:hypothetical protein